MYSSHSLQPSDPDAKYLFLAWEIQAFGFKSDRTVLTFTFPFSCLIFFSFAGHLVGFILLGNVFRKAFRILGLHESKGRWVVEQDFHENFQINVTRFFAFFYGVLD